MANWSGLNPTQFIHEIHLQNAANTSRLHICLISSQPTYLANELQSIQSFYVAGTSKRVALIDVVLCHCLPCIPAVQYFNVSNWHVIWTQHWLRESAKADIRSQQEIDIQLLYMFQMMRYEVLSFIQFWGLFGSIFGMICAEWITSKLNFKR